MRCTILLLLLAALASCRTAYRLPLPPRPPGAMTGSALYRQAGVLRWNEREPIVEQQILSGNVPSFLRKLIRISVAITDSLTGNPIRISYYVIPDYLSVGSDADWARVPLTPLTALRLADSLQCFLPTPKMVDEIYRQSGVKLEPVPLFAFRDSAITFWHHHLIIEGQRQGRRGLIAGIKKDVVTPPAPPSRPDRVSIYGWHKPGGKPIQPLYSGHVNWYVDYSHGIRLVYRKIRVGRKWMDYTGVLQDPVLKRVLLD